MMDIEIPYGQKRLRLSVNETVCRLILAKSRNPAPTRSWEAIVAEALERPVGAKRIREEHLSGKKVVIVTDDWGRPTPAYRVIPLFLRELADTGISDENITFITASGMHDPMSKADLERKLGAEIVRNYHCITHDGGDWDSLAFVGISPMGTPVWMNRAVVEADYRIGLGRVYLHVTHGYEGGYKLLLPGVSGFDSILRDHSFNFSEDSVPGIHENPSRMEADNIGRTVGFHFLVNVVVNENSEPFQAFAGAVEPVHQRAIEYGDREIWGAETGALADITVASHGSSAIPKSGFDSETLRRACAVTKSEGTVIVPVENPIESLPNWQAGEVADDAFLESLSREEFGRHLTPLAFSELMRLHERRDWRLSPREIQWRVKSIRGEFYRRRWLKAASERRVLFATDVEKALQEALAAAPDMPTVLILPEGATTLPKVRLHRAKVE